MNDFETGLELVKTVREDFRQTWNETKELSYRHNWGSVSLAVALRDYHLWTTIESMCQWYAHEIGKR